MKTKEANKEAIRIAISKGLPFVAICTDSGIALISIERARQLLMVGGV